MQPGKRSQLPEMPATEVPGWHTLRHPAQNGCTLERHFSTSEETAARDSIQQTVAITETLQLNVALQALHLLSVVSLAVDLPLSFVHW